MQKLNQTLLQKSSQSSAEPSTKRRATRNSPGEDPLNPGIPNVPAPRRPGTSFSNFEPQKHPSDSYPLAGQIRISKSYSLTASSGSSNDLPRDFQVNTG